MRSIAVAQLRAYKGRYLASGLAVAIAVAFVAATLTLAETSTQSMRNSVAEQFTGTDAAALVPESFADRTAAIVADLPGVESVAMDTTRWVSVTSGPKFYGQVQLTAIAPDEPLRWQSLSTGNLPRGDDEVVAYSGSNFAVGQTFYVRPDVDTTTDRVARKMTVVGLLDKSSMGTSTPALFGTNAAVSAIDLGRAADRADEVVLRMAFAPDADPATVMSAIRTAVATVPGAEAMTGTAAADEVMGRYVGGADLLTTVLLVFAAITALVSCLVIANTFAVLVASRTQELALLRCVGAEAKQVRAGMRIEALILGLIASAIGAVVGIGGVAGASAIVRLTGSKFPLSDLTVPVTAPVVGVLLGLVMTFVAATIPARLATRVSPLAALGALAPAADRRRGVARAVTAATMAVGGVVVMVVGVAAKSVPIAGFGGAVSFLGVMFAGVVYLPPLISWAGGRAAWLLRKTSAGPIADLTAAGATRHPRRTAATASALIIGITLTSTMVVGAQVMRTSVSGLISDEHPVDLVVSSSSPLPAQLVHDVRATDGVDGAVPVTRTQLQVNGVDMSVGAVDVDQLPGLMRSGPVPKADEIALAPEDQLLAGVSPGDHITLAGGGVSKMVTVVEGDAGSYVDRGVASAAPEATGMMVAMSSAGRDSAPAVTAIRDLVAASVPDATFGGGVEIAQQLDQILTMMLRIVLALLAVAVVVALIGVGNTMALSVIDRTRENALLRVIGLSSRGVGGMLLGEATLIAVVASVVGVVLGTAFGVAGVASIVGTDRLAIPDLPVIQLAAIVVVGGLAGLASATIPARRALRADPAVAL